MKENSQPSRQVPRRTEGLAFSAGQDRDDDLQREVEKEVVRVLQEENEQLKTTGERNDEEHGKTSLDHHLVGRKCRQVHHDRDEVNSGRKKS